MVPRDYHPLKITAVLLAVVMFFAASEAAHAEWFLDSDLSTVFDNNINRAVADDNRKSDVALVPSVSFGRYSQLATSTSFAVSADVKYTEFARFAGLDNLESSLTVSLKQKKGLGSYAPWIKVFGSAAYIDYHEQFRDAVLVRSGVLLGKRVHERTFAQVGYAYETEDARKSIYDTRNHFLSARIDYLLTESVQAWIGYTFRSGIIVLYKPADPDDPPGTVFVNTFKEKMGVYRFYSDSHILSGGVNKALTTHWSANIGADFDWIRANGNLYPDSLYRASIVYSY